ncbi:MAG: hypothetical protein IE885_06105 [Campylobacterales bacterium]|nr:hypothetical protein [Campylobacterales bacterium]
MLIDSKNLKNIILKEKRNTDILVDLNIRNLNFILTQETNHYGSNKFIQRLMSNINEESGDCASVIEVINHVKNKELIFSGALEILCQSDRIQYSKGLTHERTVRSQ